MSFYLPNTHKVKLKTSGNSRRCMTTFSAAFMLHLSANPYLAFCLHWKTRGAVPVPRGAGAANNLLRIM